MPGSGSSRRKLSGCRALQVGRFVREHMPRGGLLAAGVAVASALLGSTDAVGQTESLPTPRTLPANQLGIDGGSVAAFGLSYARRIEVGSLMIGGTIGYAFEENANTFDTNIWDVIGVDGFLRVVPNDAFHGDVGISVLAFSPQDDTNIRGTFLGLYTAVMVGYRYVFVGSEFRLGVAGIEGNSEGGVMVSPRIRAVIPWGR